ncbi:hypothetical protein AB0383_10355 [Amycolatopsis sp. NPDC051373]|uniref:hypothetical protein n=1 Tax=Amycolatopsis sp. NPDC051373 TaxID=3155801 RepID=UPI003450A75F
MPTVSVDIRRKLSTLAVVTAMAATVFTAAPSATAAPSPGNPASDPFYAQPSPFPEVAPGTVLDSRPVTIRALTLPVPVRAWQVKYRSTDTSPVRARRRA